MSARGLGAAVALAAALAGCLRDEYVCSADADCDLGSFGRCELDHHCTALDASCPADRRYSDHAGARSGACFDDRVALDNPCAPGQPPALPAGCAATVCDVLPACCRSGWTEACVQAAQLRCSTLTCDTRIALDAFTATASESFDVRWDGASWHVRGDPRAALSWLAPAPGATAPRLAGVLGDTLIVEADRYPISGARSYLNVSSVDFDRDGRPTAALGFTATTTPRIGLQILKLDDGSARDISVEAANLLSWGDLDHDGFPDAVAGTLASAAPADNANTAYHLLLNIQPPTRATRDISGADTATMPGGGSGQPVRGFAWLDADHAGAYAADGQLELAAFGYTASVHRAALGEYFGNAATDRFDCTPPTAKVCVAPNTADAQSFAGAAWPARGAAQRLIVATAPTRALYRLALDGTLETFTFPNTCGACAPIIAVITRDLDGDHVLDVIAIDSTLALYTARAGSLQLTGPVPLASGTTLYNGVRSSVSGAPR